MAVTSMDRLHELAAVEDDGAAISVYLDLSPSATPTARDMASHVRSVLSTLDELRPEDDAVRRRFDAGRERVQAELEGEDPRGGREVHGLALFAGGGMFASVPLWASAGERVAVGRRFALLEVAAAQSRTSDVLLVEAGRELGRVIALHDGELVEVADAGQEIESRHHKGGWAQMNLQRWVDRTAELHLAEVAALLNRAHAAAGRPPVVIAATHENAAGLREHLDQETAAAVIGEMGNAADMGEDELLRELSTQAAEHDARREEELLERWSESRGRGDLGDGADGVLDAVYGARVETLLVAPGAAQDVFTCAQCGRMAARAEVCEYDGAFMQHEPDGIAAVVSATLLRGGDVWQLLDVDRRDLDASGGLGAIVRFAAGSPPDQGTD